MPPPGTMGPITGRVEQTPGHAYSTHLKKILGATNLTQKNFERSFVSRKPTARRAAF
jgi:hypothetical protein